MSEHDLLVAARRRVRWRQAGTASCLAAGLAGLAAALRLVPGDAGDVGWLPSLALGGAAAVLALAGGLLLKRGRAPKDAQGGRIALLIAEDCRRKRAIAYVLIPVSLLLQLAGATEAARSAALGRPLAHDELIFAAIFTLFLCAFALLLAGRGLDRLARPALDDELARAHRADALALGFGVFTATTAFLLLAALVDRAVALEAAPAAAALPIAATSIRLFLLERAADVGAE